MFLASFATLRFSSRFFQESLLFSPTSEPLSLLRQILGDFGELFQRSLQVFDDFSRQHLRLGQMGRVLQAFVAQPENVQADLIAGQQFLVSEAAPAPLGVIFAPGGPALVPVGRVEAAHKIVKMGPGQRVLLEGEVLVGPQIVNPQFPGPGSRAAGPAVEEEDVGLDPLGVEDAGRQPQQGVDITFV